MTDEQEKSLIKSLDTLSERIERQNQLLAAFLKNQSSFRSRMTAGLWTGLGTVLGATVLVSLVILILRPLSHIDWISPIVDRVIDALESRNYTPKPHRMENTP
ncbi:MAG: hypothetical protein GC165_11970 [Armatimonadetes bacterium]|nr:hypothetical protein [Armatimonadota bacterium]MBS1728162.1 hypothetical protein [Armatimonadota bacterium]